MNRQKKFTPRRRMLVFLWTLLFSAVNATTTKTPSVYPTPSPTPPGPLRIDTGRQLFVDDNQRVAFPPNVQPTPKGKGDVRMVDVVVDGNTIEHSPIGVQIGPETAGALVSGNRFIDVAQPYAIARPEGTRVIGDQTGSAVSQQKGLHP